MTIQTPHVQATGSTSARLTAAFSALRTADILAHQMHLCCSGCALSDIQETFDKQPGVHVGFVFYHLQDYDTAIERGTLYIRYGASEEGAGEVTDEAVGDVVKRTLLAAGLKAEWDGDASSCITVQCEGGL